MVIVLTQYEKKTFISFLALYLGASALLIIIIASLFYKMEYGYEYNSVISKMQIKANYLSSKIIMKHMKGKKFNPDEYTSDLKCAVELYDKKNKPLLDHIEEDINFTKKVYIKKNMIYLVSDATYGHLDIYHIVLKNHWFIQKNKLLKKTIIMFTIIYIFIAIIGYFLSKIFLKPIVTQREKLDNFIKDTTHELNTPITALLMSINKKDPTSPKNIKRINLSAKRISEIYMDLTYLFLEDKDTSKIDNLINAKDIINDNIDYFKELATRKGIAVNIDLNDTLIDIKKESFTRLTNNLISNAVKYSKRDGTINIKLKNNQLIVEDNGIGIGADKQKDIFKRFYRATSQEGGFGIGLDIVSNICNEYNFTIDLKSQKNKGTTFTLSF